MYIHTYTHTYIHTYIFIDSCRRYDATATAAAAMITGTDSTGHCRCSWTGVYSLVTGALVLYERLHLQLPLLVVSCKRTSCCQ